MMETMAGEMLSLAKRYGLTILAVQPLNQFEGWPAGSVREEWGRRKAERWLRLCSKLAVELIQVSLATVFGFVAPYHEPIVFGDSADRSDG